MGFDYLDVEPDAVDRTGRAVQGTAADWQSWAANADTRLREAGAVLHSTRIGAAWLGYCGDTSQANYALAGMVELLGTNTRAGATTAADADVQATSELLRPGAEIAGLADRIGRAS